MYRYIDDAMPWRFDKDSRVALDDDDRSVMDVWKIVRAVEGGYFSLVLPAPVFDGRRAEPLGDYWGIHYNLGSEAFARQETVGLFCFMDRELAIEFGHKIRDKKSWNVEGSGLFLMRGKAILPELIRPKYICKMMKEWAFINFYKDLYFNSDMQRWARGRKTMMFDPWVKQYCVKLKAGHFLFAGILPLEFEPLPPRWDENPKVKEFIEQVDSETPEPYDPDDPQWDFLDK